MREIDLDLLAAQAEHNQEEIAVTFKGTKFLFPPEMPAGISLVSAEILGDGGRMSMVLRGMEIAFNTAAPGQWDMFLNLGPTRDDLYRLWGALLDTYAVTEGESSSSAASSAPAGDSSKPSSSTSTSSTRGKSSQKQGSAAS